MEMLDVVGLERETKVSRYTWRAWIREGRIPVFRLGRTVRVSRDDLDRFLAESRREGAVR
jgi:excisionase family DNA binding protein